MCGMHLASGNIENFLKNLFHGNCLNRRTEDVPERHDAGVTFRRF